MGQLYRVKRDIHLLNESLQNRSKKKLVAITATAFILVLLTFSPAFAAVNLKDASYISKWTDVIEGSFKQERTYESRSTHKGLFGYGWCSNLDLTLAQTSSHLSLNVCGKNHTFTTNNNQVYVGSRSELGQIENAATEFIWTRGDGAKARFADHHGIFRVVGWTEPRGRETRFEYGPDRLPRNAATGEGLRVRYATDPREGRITKIELSNGKVVEYKYRSETLSEIKNAWANTFRHEYDALNNLTRTIYPDETQELIQYADDRDQVVSITNRKRCTETYEYKIDRKPSAIHLIAFAKQQACLGKSAKTIKARIHQEQRADGSFTTIHADIQEEK